jgi:hypothetical protein
MLDYMFIAVGEAVLPRHITPGMILIGCVKNVLCGGALSFSLKDSSIGVGNVWPFSQMSRSFLIFSYTMDYM